MYARTDGEVLGFIVKTGVKEGWQRQGEKKKRQNSLAVAEREDDQGFRESLATVRRKAVTTG